MPSGLSSPAMCTTCPAGRFGEQESLPIPDARSGTEYTHAAFSRARTSFADQGGRPTLSMDRQLS